MRSVSDEVLTDPESDEHDPRFRIPSIGTQIGSQRLTHAAEGPERHQGSPLLVCADPYQRS